jgi:glucokinase
MAWDLVADIGGTHMRFGAVRDGELTDVEIMQTNGGRDILDALSVYISSADKPPRNAMVAIAGMVGKNSVAMTNSHQKIELREFKSVIQSDQCVLMNDFEAAAWALANVNSNDVRTLQGSREIELGNRVAIGPGTGLGVGALIYKNDQYFSVAGEGGHIGISPASRAEVSVFEALHSLRPDVFFGDTLRVEAEAILSGTGIPILYQAVCLTLDLPVHLEDAKSILDEAKLAKDPAALLAANIFKSHLGALAGDYGLALSAQGGVFLVGGVATKNPWLFDQSFLAAFNSGGRFSSARRELNVYAYEDNNFGLIGTMNALAQSKQCHQSTAKA